MCVSSKLETNRKSFIVDEIYVAPWKTYAFFCHFLEYYNGNTEQYAREKWNREKKNERETQNLVVSIYTTQNPDTTWHTHTLA